MKIKLEIKLAFMQSTDLDVFISLILIKNVETFRDPYSLTKVLAWKFGIISIVEVINKLQKQELIIEIVKGEKRQFEITRKGLDFIQSNMADGREMIMSKYEGEQDLIHLLLD